jgi:hypothetical protein
MATYGEKAWRSNGLLMGALVEKNTSIIMTEQPHTVNISTRKAWCRDSGDPNITIPASMV